MSPKVAFVDQGALMMAGEIVNVIKVENVNNVVQFSSTNVVIWDARVDWWLIWTTLLTFSTLMTLT